MKRLDQVFFFCTGQATVWLKATVLSSVVSSVVHAADLNQVYQDALQRDPEYSAAVADAKAVIESVAEGRSKLLPSLELKASYAQNRNDIETSGGSALTNSGSQDTDTTEWWIGVSQQLIDLGAWQAYQASKARSQGGDFKLLEAQQALILRAASSYLKVLSADDHLQSVQAELEAVARSLEQTKQRFNVGLIAITEVHEAQAVYDDSSVKLITAQSELDIAFEEMAKLTGQHYSGVHPMSVDIPLEGVSQHPRAYWEQLAFDTNVDLKVRQAELKAARADYQSRKAGHYPTLSLNADYGAKGTDFGQVQNGGYKRQETEGFGWSLKLTVPLYSGGATYSRHQQAFYKVQAAEMALESQKLKVLVALRSKYRMIDADIQRIAARRQSIVSSRSALEATRAGYEAGTRNIVEVLQAEQKLYQAEDHYARARYEYVEHLLEFKRNLGILAEIDIEMLNGWLASEPTVKVSAS